MHRHESQVERFMCYPRGKCQPRSDQSEITGATFCLDDAVQLARAPLDPLGDDAKALVLVPQVGVARDGVELIDRTQGDEPQADAFNQWCECGTRHDRDIVASRAERQAHADIRVNIASAPDWHEQDFHERGLRGGVARGGDGASL